MTRADVESVIERLTPGPVQVQWGPGMGSSADSNRKGEHTVTFGDGLRDDSDCAFFFAAHEAGHIALGHTSIRVKRQALSLMTMGYVVLFVAVFVVGVTVHPLAGLLTFWAGCLIPLHLLLRLRNVPQELQADDFAQDQGHSITRVQAHAQRSWAHVVLPTHPRWDARQQHAQQRIARRCS